MLVLAVARTVAAAVQVVVVELRVDRNVMFGAVLDPQDIDTRALLRTIPCDRSGRWVRTCKRWRFGSEAPGAEPV